VYYNDRPPSGIVPLSTTPPTPRAGTLYTYTIFLYQASFLAMEINFRKNTLHKGAKKLPEISKPEHFFVSFH
jgi:hypothetical protein